MTEELVTRDGRRLTVTSSASTAWWRGIATTVLLAIAGFLAQQLWTINSRLAKVEQRLSDIEHPFSSPKER